MIEEQTINNTEKQKWETLGFMSRAHYLGWAKFNGLDTTPFSGNVTANDIEYLSTIFDVEQEHDLYENDETIHDIIKEYESGYEE